MSTLLIIAGGLIAFGLGLGYVVALCLAAREGDVPRKNPFAPASDFRLRTSDNSQPLRPGTGRGPL